LPAARPGKGRRERVRGVSVMYIPTQEECLEMIANRLVFPLRF